MNKDKIERRFIAYLKRCCILEDDIRQIAKRANPMTKKIYKFRKESDWCALVAMDLINLL